MFDVIGELLPSASIVSGIVFILLLIVFGVLSMWRKVPTGKALVIKGPNNSLRVIAGGGGIIIPILYQVDVISLESINLEVRVRKAYTTQGVDINVSGVAVIKVKSDTNESILAALERFNAGNANETVLKIRTIAHEVLSGKLREIISRLTVEEVYRDRERFSQEILLGAKENFAEMGLLIETLTIQEISDDNGYLEALGKERVAEVKKEAEIAEARARRDAEIEKARARKETEVQTAEAVKDGQAAQLRADADVAEERKNTDLKIQGYKKEQETARANADLAYEIEGLRIKQQAEREKMQIDIIRKEKETELAQKEAERKEKELEATVKKQAEAEQFQVERQADAARYQKIQESQAEAAAIEAKGRAAAEARRLEGMAEVEIIREKGMAEAAAIEALGEAYKKYEQPAMTLVIMEKLIEKMPEIARNIAEPLSRIERITIVDSGNGNNAGASKVTNYVTELMTRLPDVLKTTTGIDLQQFLLKQIDQLPEGKDEAAATYEESRQMEHRGAQG
ncbi:flotillin family protein [Heliobacterium undosum]|uniref:Flotillin family protein n=1 Tax=Heliomicrobium undosum TaxID=121734 RepID=A0A845KXY2_9FIRM|nr:SPFH domain-containing protein [Heliomicrobium undosum]MZP28562.1 flotillin family protein [Heliomicrobium undosum]